MEKSRFPVRDDVDALSSEQISIILDKLLFAMVEPTILYTGYGMELAATVIVLLQNHRRRIADGNVDGLAEKLLRGICLDDRKSLLDAIVSAKLERNIPYFYTGLVAEASGRYDTFTADGGARIPAIPPHLTAHFEPLRLHMQHLAGLYDDFRHAVIGRYETFIARQAEQQFWARERVGIAFDKGDAVQNCCLAAVKSLDKFYHSNGPLAPYLKRWVTNSYTSGFALNVGESYSITRQGRKQIADGKLLRNNKSRVIEDALEKADESDFVNEVERAQYERRFFYLVSRSRLAKECKLGMLLCGVNYVLTEKEISLLKGDPK